MTVHGGIDSAGGGVVQALCEAADAGYRALSSGANPVTAVETAIRMLEADPLFNAGVGSVLNEDGTVETDAGIADGFTGRFAGVAALVGTVHPISIAAELLRRSPGPVLLAGEGAHQFARQMGAPDEDLRTAEQREIWSQARNGDALRSPFTGRQLLASDTVGAIAIDSAGHLAAGSSTGGLLLKMPGRVGDAAIFGAGIYADAQHAVLCSGLGEAAIELSLAIRTATLDEQCRDPETATAWAVQQLRSRGAVGGIVLFSAEQDLPAVAHNAVNFPVVAAGARGHVVVPARRVAR